MAQRSRRGAARSAVPKPQPPPDQRPDRVLTDPRAIRALAHPARLAVLDALSGGEELTATACAQLANSTPSAMSYHLRALEKWGFVERVSGGGDGRERPWRAVGGGWRVDAMPDAATAAATSAVTSATLERLGVELSRWFAHEGEQPQEWRSATLLAGRRVWLTADEAMELRKVYEEFLDGLRGRTAADHPPGARRVRVMDVLVPVDVDD